MDVKKINSTTAREKFSDLLNKTGFGKSRIIITRKGKAVSAMVPIEDLEAIEAWEDQKDITEAERIMADKESEFIPWEQAKKELASR